VAIYVSTFIAMQRNNNWQRKLRKPWLSESKKRKAPTKSRANPKPRKNDEDYTPYAESPTMTMLAQDFLFLLNTINAEFLQASTPSITVNQGMSQCHQGISLCHQRFSLSGDWYEMLR
jgi:hypothetical protein